MTEASTYKPATLEVRKMSLLVSTEPENAKKKIWAVVVKSKGVLPRAAVTIGCSLRVMYAWLRKLGLLDDARLLRQKERANLKDLGIPIFVMQPRKLKPAPTIPKATKGRGRKAVVVET